MDINDMLAARAIPVSAHPSSTSYFSAPEHNLDPSLFDPRSHMLLPNVRMQVLTTLYHFWDRRYTAAHSWSTVWIAGSGASYQWKAARSPSDLDVLIGVDYYRFRMANAKFARLGDAEISTMMNDEFRAYLDPMTAHVILNRTAYEQTFYVNIGATDIRMINPYAAYNVTQNNWTVPPDPSAAAPHNREYKAGVREDRTRAKEILREYQRALREVRRAKDPGQKLNAESWLKHATEHGAQLFDDIHQGRHAAFSPGGQGYGDYANYRWQSGKANGTVQALQQLKALKKNTQEQYETSLYGAPVEDAEHALLKATLWQAGQE